MIGYEGMHGAGCALGVSNCVFDAVVQMPGYAWRVDAAVLACTIPSSKILHGMLTGYSYVQHAQMAGRAVCCQFHSLLQRLSNYLLKVQDRQRCADLLVTHDALSRILGARRASITEAAGELQKRGLIRYCRGHILVLDRPGLATIACGCYAQDVAAYEGIMAGFSQELAG
jgi:hypothetical protein